MYDKAEQINTTAVSKINTCGSFMLFIVFNNNYPLSFREQKFFLIGKYNFEIGDKEKILIRTIIRQLNIFYYHPRYKTLGQL